MLSSNLTACPCAFNSHVHSVYPLPLLGCAIAGMQKALEGLKEGKVPEGDYTFDSIKKVVGFPEYFEELEQLEEYGRKLSGA